MATSESTENSFDEYEHDIDPRLKALVAILIGLISTVLITWILGGPLGSVMDKIVDRPIYHFIPFVVSITFFVVLMYKAYVKDIRGLEFLATAVLLHGLGEGLNIIRSGKDTIFNRPYDEPLDIIPMFTDLFIPIAVVLLYLHVELTDKLRPAIKQAIGIIGTAAPLIVGGILLIAFRPIDKLDGLTEDIRAVVTVYLGLFALIVLWVSVFGFKVMYFTMKHADSPQIANASLMVLIGFSSLLANFLLVGATYSSGLRDSPILFGNDFTIHSSWILTYSLTLLLLAYILNPEFAYSVPFDVYQLLVINSDQGVTLFSFINEIRQEQGSVTHAALKSPAIVAIQNLVQEIASAEGHIMLIGMSDRILVLKNKNQIVSVLIAERNSYFINKGLEDFTAAFYEQFSEHINNFTGNVDVFRDANLLIRKHLPFMRRESLVVSKS